MVVYMMASDRGGLTCQKRMWNKWGKRCKPSKLSLQNMRRHSVFLNLLVLSLLWVCKEDKVTPVYNSIITWYTRIFEEDGYLCDSKRSGRRKVSKENVEQVREVFQHNPSKFTRGATEAEAQHSAHNVVENLKQIFTS